MVLLEKHPAGPPSPAFTCVYRSLMDVGDNSGERVARGHQAKKEGREGGDIRPRGKKPWQTGETKGIKNTRHVD